MKLNDTDRGPLKRSDTPIIEPERERRASDDTQLIGTDHDPMDGHGAHPAGSDRPLIESEATSPTEISSVDASTFALSLPFRKTTATPDARENPSEAETASLAILLLDDGKDVSADVAESERIVRPSLPVFVPNTKRRRTRSLLTIVISIFTVLALVTVGVLFAVKSQTATPEQRALETYSARELTVANADRKLTSTFTAIATAKADAEAVNLAAAAALASVAGVSDETARAAVETQRVTSATAVTEVAAVDPAENPYAAPGVSAGSSLSVIGAALDAISSEQIRIEGAQLELDAALTAIAEARTALTIAFATFAETIPATATALNEANPDADQEWRDSVTAAVTALTAAVENGAGAAELQTYAAAAFALQDENARVLLEQESVGSEEDVAPRRTPQRPRDDSNPDRDPPSNPSPPSSSAPVNPSPVDPKPIDPPDGPSDPEVPGPVDPPADEPDVEP